MKVIVTLVNEYGGIASHTEIIHSLEEFHNIVCLYATGYYSSDINRARRMSQWLGYGIQEIKHYSGRIKVTIKLVDDNQIETTCYED